MQKYKIFLKYANIFFKIFLIMKTMTQGVRHSLHNVRHSLHDVRHSLQLTILNTIYITILKRARGE